MKPKSVGRRNSRAFIDSLLQYPYFMKSYLCTFWITLVLRESVMDILTRLGIEEEQRGEEEVWRDTPLCLF